ncbi:HRAS-like suppressor family, member 5, isoform CRA_a [Mus musculus]|nr:HRAS-like suppressor family, member 5, isoform CRA_a [Mus musculus]
MIPGLGGPWSAPPCRRVVPAGPSGMGLSPAASGEFGIRLSRVPWPRPTQISKTSSTESSDTQSATGQSTVPHSDSASSQALLVQFLPKQLKQDRRLEQARSFQQGEKPETSLELTPSKKRTELIPTSNSEIESTQKNQAVEVRIPGIHRMSVLVSWSLLTASCFTLRLINICTDMRDWLCVF